MIDESVGALGFFPTLLMVGAMFVAKVSTMICLLVGAVLVTLAVVWMVERDRKVKRIP